MAEQDQPEQIRLMKQLVDLSIERTELAKERNRMSAERSEMSADRSRMSEDRSRMSADRSEMSAERSYMNAERTLSVWVRTSLALMIFGIALDRFGLLVRERLPARLAHPHAYSNDLSNWTGAALVAFGVLMAVVTGVRFLAYSRTYQRSHKVPYHHVPFLAPMFALLAALFGIVLLLMMLVFFP